MRAERRPYPASMRTLLVLLILTLPAFSQEASVGDGVAVGTRRSYAQRLFDEALAAQRVVMGHAPNEWPAFEDAKARLEPLLERSASADRAAMRAEPESEAAGLGMTTIYMVASYGSQRDYEAERDRALAMLEELREAGLFDITAELPSIAVAMPELQDKPLDFTAQSFASKARALMRIQLARMRVAGGDDAERLAALHETMALGRQVAWHGSVLDWLVGRAMVQAVASEFLLSLLLHPPADDNTLARAEAIIALEGVQRSPGIEFAVLTSRLPIRDMIERTHDADGRFVRNDIAEVALARVEDGWFEKATFEEPFADRVVTAAWFDALHEHILNAATATGAGAIEAFDTAKAFYEAPVNSPLAAVATPPTLVLVEQSTGVELAGARVVIAIERYRLRHGALPNMLDDLGDLLPEELRTDPLTGTPWVYEPRPMTLDIESQPLEEGSIAWPYSLRSAPLPGVEPAIHLRTNPKGGVPITRSIQAPQYDRP